MQNNLNNNAGYTPTSVNYGVNSVMAMTLPRFDNGYGVSDIPDETTDETMDNGPYNGPYAGKTFLNEPFAVWLGMVLVLILLKVLSESPKTSINPAKIEVGGYNWLTIGVSAATFAVLMKVLFNRFKVPGLTEFVNAI